MVFNILSKSSPPIKTILLDLDGVLRYWPSDTKSIEDKHGLPHGSITSVAFARENLDPAIRGFLEDAQWRELIASELLRMYPKSDAGDAVRCWSEPVGRIDLKVQNALKSYSAHARLVLATNATSRLDTDLQQLGIRDLFFGIANSSEMNTVKPEKAFYLAALEIANTDAKQAIYIDDDTNNVQMAEKIGIRSHHFTGVAGMSKFLEKSILIDQ